ncbi:hypothetical protein BGZ83_004669 [Gryganskiella cystojenkinii]|nr:hypothetical protein BGZ83_004669 [Gryganskiella cystojenkinii]
MTTPGQNLLPKSTIRSYIQPVATINNHGEARAGAGDDKALSYSTTVTTVPNGGPPPRAPQLYHNPDESSAYGAGGGGGNVSDTVGMYFTPPQAPQQYTPQQEQMMAMQYQVRPEGPQGHIAGGGGEVTTGDQLTDSRTAAARRSTNPQAITFPGPHGEPMSTVEPVVTTPTIATTAAAASTPTTSAAAIFSSAAEAINRQDQPQSKDGQGPQGYMPSQSEAQVPVVYQPGTPLMSPPVAHHTLPFHTQVHPAPQPMSPWLYPHQPLPPPQPWQSPAPTFSQPYYGSPMMMSPPLLHAQIHKPLPAPPPSMAGILQHDGTGVAGGGAPAAAQASTIGPAPGLVVHFKCRECGGPLESEFAPCRRMHVQLGRPDLQAQPELLHRPQYQPQQQQYMGMAPPVQLSTVSPDAASNYGTDDIYLRHRQKRLETLMAPVQPTTQVFYATAPPPLAGGPALVDSRMNHNNINNNSVNPYHYAPVPQTVTYAQAQPPSQQPKTMVSDLKKLWKDVRDEVNYHTGGYPAGYHQHQQPAQYVVKVPQQPMYAPQQQQQQQQPAQFGQPSPYPGYPPYQ